MCRRASAGSASTEALMFTCKAGTSASAKVLLCSRVSSQRTVPQGVPLPDWASTGVPAAEMRSPQQLQVPVRTEAQIKKLRKACQLGRAILDEAHRHVKPGVTTDEIDRVRHTCSAYIERHRSTSIGRAIISCGRALSGRTDQAAANRQATHCARRRSLWHGIRSSCTLPELNTAHRNRGHVEAQAPAQVLC